MELDDMLKMKMLESGSGMSPYETFKTQNMAAKNHTSGLGIAGLTVGVGAAILAIGGAAWAGSRAQNAKDVAIAKNDGLKDLVSTLAGTLAAERSERIAGDVTLTNTVNDSVSGSQQGTLTAQQAAELASIQSVQQNLFNQAVMGNLSENPQKVMLYSAPQPCGCPGCGCNG